MVQKRKTNINMVKKNKYGAKEKNKYIEKNAKLMGGVTAMVLH